ncbi:low molecular weight protein tyrosine phosphatase family protein [Zavarzinia sp. CC-PAN008]|uniref:low molecular weight protein tyrosine phosphatase family protein n=1 Tax=Zavarzinia sp. CC-PAN008 TaxID=3243332 RepID=UPI003F748DC9
MRRALFLCSRNRRRSPTAERLFLGWPGVEVASAGLAPDAEEPLTPDHLDGVGIIFVMERKHQAKLNRQFARQVRGARIVCLDIPDVYHFMQPELVDLLMTRVTPHLMRGRP